MPGERQPDTQLRASDAERDQVAARLRDEFVAGRLSHDTFLHRIGALFESRRQADLPPLVQDLPGGAAPGAERTLAGRLRGTWSRVVGGGQAGRRQVAPGDGRSGSGGRGRVASTTGMAAAPGPRPPFVVQFPRGGDLFSIGRDANCDLAIPDMSVSRLHARLERTPDGWLLSDLQSRNGTRVNGWLVRDKTPVHSGDLVTFGSLEVVFSGGSPQLA